MNDDPPPDAFEKRVRFGCGFLFGAVCTFLLALRGFNSIGGEFWAIVFGAAALSGFLAVRYGEDFWQAICRILRGL